MSGLIRCRCHMTQVRQMAISFTSKLHEGGRGSWEEVRSLWRNRSEVGFCCKQKKIRKKFCSKRKKKRKRKKEVSLGRKTRGVCGKTRGILTPQYKQRPTVNHTSLFKKKKSYKTKRNAQLCITQEVVANIST